MYAHRHLQMFATGAIALVTFVAAQNVRAEDWTYRADLGGWLDNETGLVWGPWSKTWTKADYSHDAAIQIGIPQYRQMTGIPGWRLPTLAEYQTAYAHNALAYFKTIWTDSGFYTWAADTKGKKQAWLFALSNGKSLLASKASSMPFRPVYRP